jgi:hypothetical protein
VTGSQIFLVSMTVTVSRAAGHIFCRMSVHWGLFAVFLTVRLGLWIWGR